MKFLDKKTSLVTGASRGIGKAVALRLAAAGARVLLHYASSRNRAAALRDRIRAEGGRAELLEADFSNLKGVDLLFEELDRVMHGVNLDILVNNAGIPGRAGNDDIDEAGFDRLVNVNLKAPFFITRRIAERMNDGGRIVNISSKASRQPDYRSGVYGMLKAALDNFTVQMASHFGRRKITVNAVGPGPIITDMNRKYLRQAKIKNRLVDLTALKGIGAPDDVAGVVAFLVSPDAGWITGQWIEVSGGLKL